MPTAARWCSSAAPIVARDLPVGDAADDGAVVRVEACGLCGTDHELYTGVLPLGYAFVPGHETVGVIESIGDDAGGALGRTGRRPCWPSSRCFPAVSASA